MNAPLPTRIPGEPVPSGDNSAGIAEAEPTPFDLSRDEIEGLYVEARNWLAGEAIRSQDEADALDKLLDMTGAAIKRADARRKEEAKPFDEAKAAVQARFNTLIGDTKGTGKGRAILLRETLQTVLTPWNVARQRERDEAAQAAREAAERARREADLALRMSDNADLGGREEAEALNRQAKEAEKAATKAARPVATGLRHYDRAEVTDARAFLNWVAANRPDALRGWLSSYADTLCAQKVRGMPGVTIHTEARAI